MAAGIENPEAARAATKNGRTEQVFYSGNTLFLKNLSYDKLDKLALNTLLEKHC